MDEVVQSMYLQRLEVKRKKNQKAFPINQNVHTSNSSITHLWSDRRKKQKKEGMINPERVHVRERVKISHLHGCSVIKVSPISRLPYFHLYFCFPTF